MPIVHLDQIARGDHLQYVPTRQGHIRGFELVPGVRLIETSGHAPGHQSVLVQLPRSGPVLLAIDAVVMKRLFTTDRKAWPIDDNEEELRASTQKLLDVVQLEKVPLTVFGHDGAQWKTLTKAPHYYD